MSLPVASSLPQFVHGIIQRISIIAHGLLAGKLGLAAEEVGHASSQITCSHLKLILVDPAESALILVPRLFHCLV